MSMESSLMAEARGKRRAHVLAVPFPAQGHVTSLFKLSRLIASHGVKVTFVNTELIHNKIAPQQELVGDTGNLVLASIPDGLPADDDRSNGFTLWESLKSTMAGHLTELVETINTSSCNEKISCLVADITVGWILEIAEDLGVECVGFTPGSAASLAMILRIPDLIEQGILDSNGNLKGREIVSLSDDIPPWRKDEFAWSVPHNLEVQKIMLECCHFGGKSAESRPNLLLCNTLYELESSACDLIPKLLPIGPSLNTSSANPSSFYVEDTSCLTWLDEQEAASVVYVSFGSVAVFSKRQLDELALGLVLSDRPFLWVVRSDHANERVEYPSRFFELGKTVEWAPQGKVLSHPSVGCFLSHCGWNSTLEGIGAGVPFLCWPYFSDQFHNRNYICNAWKIGLRIEEDENGIRGRDEIKKKIEMLFVDDEMRANALRLKDMAEKSVAKEGSSFLNFQRFILHLNE